MMRRGDIVTIADRAGQFTGKPRPAVIIQSDVFDTPSITICPLTSAPADAPLLRIAVEPSPELPLAQQSWVMVDKITTVSRQNCEAVIGRISRAELLRVTGSIATFLGLG
jgi:mRNA interferase MazF